MLAEELKKETKTCRCAQTLVEGNNLDDSLLQISLVNM